MDVSSTFPLEIWENIIVFCDGTTLQRLQRVDEFFTGIIESVDRRRGIWEKSCILEIPVDDRYDICQICCPENHHEWKLIYDVWSKWNYIKKYDFTKTTIGKKYLSISEVKVSGKMIIVSDKIGFTIVNSFTGDSKRYKIGSLRKVKLFNRSKAGSTHERRQKEFLHDTLDCTVSANFHLFFDLCAMDQITHLRQDKFEKKILRYPSNGKVLQFGYPIIDADVFEHTIFIVEQTCMYQMEKNFKFNKKDFLWNGPRCWFIWHARLLIYADESTFHLSTNGQMKTLLFGQYPRVTAIFYFNGILFLGLVQGSLFLYRINADDILQFKFENYDKKIDVCQHAIVAINIVETETQSAIILASENEVYQLRLNILA